MGRWRSGAPLILAPEKDDPDLGADLQRNNDFNYKQDGPARLRGAAWRAYSTDKSPRHGGENKSAPHDSSWGDLRSAFAGRRAGDGVERGIAAFVICASLIRQFEFAQNVWMNDKNFHELGNERDPIIGTQDGTLEFKIPKRPIRKKITGLPAFTTMRGGAYFFTRH